MATSLYDLSVPTFLQTVRAVGGFLHRTAKHCAETGADPDDFVHARLFEDMAPFHFQIEALSHHSVWGLEAVKTGVFAPPALVGAMPFGGLRAMVARRQRRWRRSRPPRSTAGPARRWTPSPPARRRRSLLGLGAAQLTFTSETFLLSFSLPNFHFHAVTAYDILRSRGVPLGKRDYEGRLRTGPPSPKSNSATDS